MAKPVKQRTVVSAAFREDNQVPRSDLPRRLQSLKEYLVDAVECDCRKFAKFVSQWRDEELYKVFADTWENFVTAHLEKPVEWIELMVEGVAILDQPQAGQPIPAEQAVSAAIEAPNRPGPPAKVNPAEVAQLRAQGMTQKAIAESLGINQSTVSRATADPADMRNSDNITITHTPKTTGRGTSKEYLQRRLKAAAPELLDEIGEGKRFRSVRAAAIEAGIVPQVKTIRISEKTTGRDLAQKLKQELSPEVWEALIKAGMEELAAREKYRTGPGLGRRE